MTDLVPTDLTPTDLTPTDLIAKSDPRLQQLSTWLNKIFPNHPFELVPLAGDASFRRYIRLHFKDNHDDNQSTDTLDAVYMVMDAPPQQESVVEFVAVADLFSSVVNVPTIVAKDIEQGFLVLQDFGNTEFAHLLKEASSEQVDEYYQWAMQSLIELQHIDIDAARQTANLPNYDEALLTREMALFTDWFLPYINVNMDDKTQTLWQSFSDKLVKQVMAQPQVVVHRDYHSRNLMRDQHNPDKLGIIDFQDAVIGAYSYDLASLVRDAYVNWDQTQVHVWIEYYWLEQQKAGLPTAPSLQAFMQDVYTMGVQRHLKVLGIFIRLSERDGKQRYLADIPKVMQDLLTSLEWLHTNAEEDVRQIVAPILDWIKQDVLPKYELKFATE